MRAHTDFLVIGSGIAGLRAAVDLAAIGDVTILTKANPEESNTGYAQGGIAAAVGADDSPALHLQDTLTAGDGLCIADVVQVLVDDGVRYVRDLVGWGVRFDRDPSGELALAREAAHSVRRVLHAADATGREISRVLWARASGHHRVAVLQDTTATELLIEDGRCVGARFIGPDGEGAITARGTLIATGGAGHVYAETTNPPVATGDGIALAWRAGARVADLEFVQFHPTVLSVPGAPRFLLSEALRGEGAWLINRDGERFVGRVHPAGELAPRDVVSRAIVQEVERTGARVYLTVAHLDPRMIASHFPTIGAVCRAAGLDLARDPIPVSPAAHYIMGGVETDVWARTAVPGLYAAGEAACTGVHGANRLASNSLLEGLVFGARAALAMQQPPQSGAMAETREVPPLPLVPEETAADAGMGDDGSDPEPSIAGVQRLMWRQVGLARSLEGLTGAAARLARWRRWLAVRPAAPGDLARGQLDTLVLVASLITAAAARRGESRGGHSRTDFSSRDDLHWHVHLAERRRP